MFIIEHTKKKLFIYTTPINHKSSISSPSLSLIRFFLNTGDWRTSLDDLYIFSFLPHQIQVKDKKQTDQTVNLIFNHFASYRQRPTKLTDYDSAMEHLRY